MIWFFIVSVLMWTFSIVYVWKAKEYIRDEIRIVYKWQNEALQLYYTLSKVIDTQRNAIRGWEHRLDIMHREIKKLKKTQKQKGDADV